ncbi:MAG: DUF45 domain-containing protein, partial [Actinomycetota bacterium]|nr:DUF45 domain-containing protein [Actinomycetota bacterium]
MRFKVTARDGLVVVVPTRYPARKIPALLQARREWIETALARVAPRREHLASHDPDVRPESLELAGIGQTWTVEYRPTAARSISAIERADARLVVSGPVHDASACRAAVRRWLTRTARHLLI